VTSAQHSVIIEHSCVILASVQEALLELSGNVDVVLVIVYISYKSVYM